MASSNFTTFQKTVAAAGTAEVLVASRTEVRSAVIQALSTNTGTVHLRDAASGADGVLLNAEQTFEISAETYDTFDLAAIFIKVSVNGEGVSVTHEE